jgi:hypothetical protein
LTDSLVEHVSIKERMSCASRSMVTLKEDTVYYLLTVSNLRCFYYLYIERKRGQQFYN